MVVMVTTPADLMTFEAFFLAEYPRLVSMLSARSGDRAAAEDLAQDALVQAERHWDEVGALDKPGAWVRRAALNRASNEFRRRGRERRAGERLGRRLAAPTADSTQLPDAQLPDAELWSIVRALPRAQRDATLLRYVDDLPLADIGEVIGCSEGTVKKHLQRARHTLSKRLADGGHANPYRETER